MLRERANGETFVTATMCPQQCVLVCQGLKNHGDFVEYIGRTLIEFQRAEIEGVTTTVFRN